MDLGISGVLNVMNSMGGLPHASSLWSPGDRVAYIFPVKKEGNKTDIPLGYKFGHAINFGEGSVFNRSWIPSRSEIDPVKYIPLGEPDFAYRVAPIFSELFKAEKEYEYEAADKMRPTEEARKLAKKEIDERYEDRSPAIGSLRLRAYAEIIVVKLDANNVITTEYNYAQLNISRKKMAQVYKYLGESAYDGGDYLALLLPTTSGKKTDAGKVDFQPFADSTKKLHIVNPDFVSRVTDIFTTNNPTRASIEAKVFDFRDYDDQLLKMAVANYLDPRDYLWRKDNGQIRETVRSQRNADILQSLGFVATAKEIESFLGKEETKQDAASTGGEAQTLNIPSGTTAANAQVAASAESTAPNTVPTDANAAAATFFSQNSGGQQQSSQGTGGDPLISGLTPSQQ